MLKCSILYLPSLKSSHFCSTIFTPRTDHDPPEREIMCRTRRSMSYHTPLGRDFRARLLDNQQDAKRMPRGCQYRNDTSSENSRLEEVPTPIFGGHTGGTIPTAVEISTMENRPPRVCGIHRPIRRFLACPCERLCRICKVQHLTQETCAT